jgi:hypothetical protein
MGCAGSTEQGQEEPRARARQQEGGNSQSGRRQQQQSSTTPSSTMAIGGGRHEYVFYFVKMHWKNSREKKMPTLAAL